MPSVAKRKFSYGAFGASLFLVGGLFSVVNLASSGQMSHTEPSDTAVAQVQPEVKAPKIPDAMWAHDVYPKSAVVTVPSKAVGGATEAPFMTDEQWVAGIAADAGIVPPVPITVTTEDNCGVGCTVTKGPGGPVQKILIDPVVIGTEVGKHVVLHELAHAAEGILNECAADDFAHAHGSNPLVNVENCKR